MSAWGPVDLAQVTKIFDRTQLKTLTPKNMFQRLAIALAEVKAGNTFEILLNDFIQIKYSMYKEKKNFFLCKQLHFSGLTSGLYSKFTFSRLKVA